MKANKALKRLAKIDSLMTDVAERFKGSLQIREALQDAKAALDRARAAVTSQASSGTAKTSKADSKNTPKPAKRKLVVAVKQAIQERVGRRIAKKKEATAKAAQPKKKTAPARKKAAAKTIAAKAPAATTARKGAPIKKAAKKNALPKRTAQASMEIPATVDTTPVHVEPKIEPAAVSVGR